MQIHLCGQRKLLIAKKIDPEELRTEDLETTPIPPASFLTPRPPTTDPESGEERQMKSAKSEPVIAHLTRQGSGSSFNHGSPGFTSTPKSHGSQTLRHHTSRQGDRQQPQGEARRPPIDLASSLPWPGSYGGPPARTQHKPSESDSDYNRSNDSFHSDLRPGKLPSSHSLGFNQLPPPPPPYQSRAQRVTPHQNSDSNLYRSLPLKPNNPPPPPPHLQNGPSKKTNNNNKYGDYMPMDGAQRSIQNDSVDYNRKTYEDPFARSNGSRSSDSQYQPSNVRNLVQSFQQSVKHEPPVPPPRKPRSSLGGPQGSPQLSMGGSGSAFSVPSYTTMNINSFSNGPTNINNNAISDKTQPDRPGSTPPRPAPQGRDGQPKPNSVWYEYGCV